MTQIEQINELQQQNAQDISDLNRSNEALQKKLCADSWRASVTKKRGPMIMRTERDAQRLRVTRESPGSGGEYEIIAEVIGSAGDLIDIGVWDESGNGHYARMTPFQARLFSKKLADFIHSSTTDRTGS